MKTSLLAAAIAACTLSAPILSAQELPATAGSAKSTDIDRQMSQMQENMKEALRGLVWVVLAARGAFHRGLAAV